jgi:hypothetical protein
VTKAIFLLKLELNLLNGHSSPQNTSEVHFTQAPARPSHLSPPRPDPTPDPGPNPTPFFTPEMYETKHLCAPLGPPQPTSDKEKKHPDPDFKSVNKRHCEAFVIATSISVTTKSRFFVLCHHQMYNILIYQPCHRTHQSQKRKLNCGLLPSDTRPYYTHTYNATLPLLLLVYAVNCL